LAEYIILKSAVKMAKSFQSTMDKRIESFILLTQWVREIEISAHDFSRGKTILKIILTVSTVYSLN